MWGMTPHDINEAIREANLGYLLLAQGLIRTDRPQALRRLGLADDVAWLLARLSPAQLRVLALSEALLPSLRHPQDRIWSVLGDPCEGDDDPQALGGPPLMTQAQIDHELLAANRAHLCLLQALAASATFDACPRLNLTPADLQAVAVLPARPLMRLAQGRRLLASVRPLRRHLATAVRSLR